MGLRSHPSGNAPAPARVWAHALAAGFVLASLLGSACAHVAVDDPARSSRRLLSLERDFVQFSTQRVQTLDDIEAATARLEMLRLGYLDALPGVTTERDRMICLVRIAELHLDLGARIRRVPYPKGETRAEQQAFDETLSQAALPLEATGVGVLTQALDDAEHRGADGRFIRRARLYLALHGASALGATETAWLMAELAARSKDPTFAAPQALLEVGRMGQRAARR